MNKNFTDLHELIAFIQNKEQGNMVVGYYHLHEYAGMALYIGFAFDQKKEKYELNLEWISLGLDFYGDTLQESYLYKFDTFEKLIEYLELKYNIAVTDIALKFEFETNKFPNPVKNADQKPQFEAAWQQFRGDFKQGIFLDPSLGLVYSSDSRGES